MGYGLMVYAIDIDRLQAVCGSGDIELYEAIVDRYRSDIASVNTALDLESYHQSDPSIFEGIRHLIMGLPKNFDGAIYGYSVEFIVKYFGTFLDNSMFYPCDLNFLSDTIGDRSIGISIDNLIFRRPITGLPFPDDFPMYGHISNSEVANVADLFRNILEEYKDREMDELACIAGWFQFAADRQLGLVGYYY
jgi:hypothetical protein